MLCDTLYRLGADTVFYSPLILLQLMRQVLCLQESFPTLRLTDNKTFRVILSPGDNDFAYPRPLAKEQKRLRDL